MRDDRERLLDILEAIGNIETYTIQGRDAFDRDRLVRTWIVHHVQVIGEAAARLSPGVRRQYPSVPWADIVSMRNVVVHQYFGIDYDQVWDTVAIDLPKLRRHVEGILGELGAAST